MKAWWVALERAALCITCVTSFSEPGRLQSSDLPVCGEKQRDSPRISMLKIGVAIQWGYPYYNDTTIVGISISYEDLYYTDNPIIATSDSFCCFLVSYLLSLSMPSGTSENHPSPHARVEIIITTIRRATASKVPIPIPIPHSPFPFPIPALPPRLPAGTCRSKSSLHLGWVGRPPRATSVQYSTVQ